MSAKPASSTFTFDIDVAQLLVLSCSITVDTSAPGVNAKDTITKNVTGAELRTTGIDTVFASFLDAVMAVKVVAGSNFCEATGTVRRKAFSSVGLFDVAGTQTASFPLIKVLWIEELSLINRL
ncbi:hypothetical protein Rhopal_003869-T1 [Rhodotorula paludigena]|uniref:Uncharacterized protein n=1 Tax=Rhodotorula paludigena TaxID=86838 RepID=A0AAV5GMW3_9BASI|nr:hypothetical protein Rhopal_003869-T1 [Rhodotorula paludigena]